MATNSIAIPVVQINSNAQAVATCYFPSTGLIVQTAAGTTSLGGVILSSIQSVHLRDRLDGSPIFFSTLTASAISVLQNT